ncbi:MAG: MTH938/NDUFAF3 family protein [Burkholderiales bacterium]|jgi:uncharacterized protein|nr:MTH938/NDUFAF3 family protein [Burkholderiales bacterium]
MKLHQDRLAGVNAFSGYGPDHVIVGTRRLDRSVIVFPDRVIEDWPVHDAAQLDAAALAVFTTAPIEILLIGTGPKMVLVHPRVYAPVSAARIGVEVMDTFAACRTYNVLIAEGRKVAAAVILPAPA